MSPRRRPAQLAAILVASASCARILGFDAAPLVDDGDPQSVAADAAPDRDAAPHRDAGADRDASDDDDPRDGGDGGDADRGDDGGDGYDAGDAAPDASGSPDADAPCDPDAPFGAPVPLASINTPGYEYDARFSLDELTVYWASDRELGNGNTEIYTAKRARIGAPFGAPERVPLVDRTFHVEFAPSITDDGLSLYYNATSDSDGTNGIWVATRGAADAPFSAIAPVPHVNGDRNDSNPMITPDGSALYFFSDRSGRRAIYVSTLGDGGVTTPQRIDALDTDDAENLAINADQTVIAFATTRAPTRGEADIWMSRRATARDEWSAPTPVDEVNGSWSEFPTWISPDGCRMYLESDRVDAPFDIYVATRGARR